MEEATSALSGPTAPWSVNPPPYQTNGADLEFIEPMQGGSKFYRLRKP